MQKRLTEGKTESVGVVVIGRNEGDRLKRCISSITDQASIVVYVDSGSTDGSVEWVNGQGIELVCLDLSKPFTAARARNQGFSRLKELAPDIAYVQFVDGDCEVDQEWIKTAASFLASNSEVAVVCGRRRERYPEKTVYNALCDIEWNTPLGEALSCGGDSMMRTNVFALVEGFNAELIAGEEPELCVRIRASGYKIWRLDEEMTLHDADMYEFHQWWKRSRRCGYAYALGASIHGFSDERFRIKEVVRIVFWGFCVPLATLLLTFFSPYFIFLLSVYPIQWFRLISNTRHLPANIRSRWALYNVLGKFPEFLGVVELIFHRVLKKRAAIIEYK